MATDTRKKTDEKPAKTWLAVLSVILALLLVGGIVYNVCDSNGVFLRSRVSVSSEHYSVNNAMLSYYYHYDYNYFVTRNASYLAYFNLDTSKPLKSQIYDKNSGTTWYDYFMNTALNDAKQALYLCEAARANGLTLTEEDYKSIDESIEGLKTAAKAYNVSLNRYISSMYGNGVKEKDLRKCFELSTLASKQYDKMMESYSFTEEERQKYCEENKESFFKADYMSYVFKAEFADDASEKDILEAKDNAKKLADELAGKNTKDDFFNYISEYLKSQKKDDAEESKDDKKDEEVTADKYLTEEHSYGTESELDKWLFEEGRAEGDTKVVSAEDDSKKTYSYTVYLVIKPQYRLEYSLVNVRHILIEAGSSATDAEKEAAKAKAEKLLEDFKNGEQTGEAFAKLVKDNSTDTGSVENGGLYENVSKGDMVTEFNDWCFEDGRKVGDTGVVKTTYGYHVMYLEGFGDAKWSYDAEQALKQDAYEKEYESYQTKYPVTTNLKNAAKVG